MFDPEQDRRSFNRFGLKIPTNYNQINRTASPVDPEYERLATNYNKKWHEKNNVERTTW